MLCLGHKKLNMPCATSAAVGKSPALSVNDNADVGFEVPQTGFVDEPSFFVDDGVDAGEYWGWG